MRFSHFLLFAMATMAIASPLANTTDGGNDCPKNCNGQKSPCNYCKSGNTDIGLGTKKYSWGAVHPIDMILALKDQCHAPLISCSLKRQTYWEHPEQGNPYSPSYPESGTVTLTLKDASEVANDDLLHKLIDGMREAVSTRTSTHTVKYADAKGHYHHLDEQSAPTQFDIQLTDGSNVKAKLIFTVDIQRDKEDDGGGVCSDILSGAIAVAGALSGVASGFFLLASLACNG